MDAKPTLTVYARVPPKLHAAIKEYAEELGITMAVAVNLITREGLTAMGRTIDKENTE